MVQSPSHRTARIAAVAGAAVLTLAVVAPTLAQSPASGEGKLFVAINKAADQQYFIDLQNSFVSTIEGLGGTAEKYDAKDQAELGVNLVNDAISIQIREAPDRHACFAAQQDVVRLNKYFKVGVVHEAVSV